MRRTEAFNKFLVDISQEGNRESRPICIKSLVGSHEMYVVLDEENSSTENILIWCFDRDRTKYARNFIIDLYRRSNNIAADKVR